MANPIPLRPWSRLASLRSTQFQQPSESPQPSLQPTNTYSHDNNESATKSLSPKPHVHSPIQSPNMKLTTPITLPPSELTASPHIKSKMEAEETIEKPNENGNGQNEKQVTNMENKTKEKGIRTTKLSGSEGIRVITIISGENTGACMRITKSKKKYTYDNNNVQCVNNSMVFNTSLTYHDPGVRHIIP
ncbi:hypothetical protein Fmac_010687 [Flemingia macrophylla]|uniref:Uncharacterized protein n=1 Tax=Flemingia macrophylla TaxID=520843 RepID=A0ABD1MKK5_9FABA